MPNVIPPLLSSTPPPVVGGVDDDEEDEFGDFTTANDLSYEMDGISAPSTPEHLPIKTADKIGESVDINSNSSESHKSNCFEKDFQDRRKSCDKIEDFLEYEGDFVGENSDFENTSNSLEVLRNGTFTIDDDEKSEHLTEETKRQDVLETFNEHKSIHDSFKVFNLDETCSENHNRNLSTEATEQFQTDLNLESSQQTPQLTTNHSVPEPPPHEVEILPDSPTNKPEPADFTPAFEISDLDVQFHDETQTIVAPNEPTGDYGDFADFEDFTFTADFPEPVEMQSADDDFGDFDSYVVETKAEDALAKYFDGVTEKSERIIREAFELVASDGAGDTVESSDLDCDEVFGNLKDITETKALKFQWVDSASQKVLLKSLNIDMRNILYGPGLNLSVPKFAAALSSSPLEPLKPEVLTPTVPSPSINRHDSSVQPSADVPSAQFDWNSAGLTNPLDSISSETDDKFLHSLDLDSQLPSNSKTDATFLDPQVFQTSKDSNSFVENVSTYPTQKETSPQPQMDDDFGPFESTKPNYNVQETTVTMVPLRETHIYNEKIVADTKTVDFDFLSDETKTKPEFDDEFDDFQMSLPQQAPKEPVFEAAKVVSYDTPQTVNLEPLQPVKIQPASTVPPKIEWPDPGITEDDINSIELNYKNSLVTEEVVKIEDRKIVTKADDDDWTDFVSNTEPMRAQTPTKSSPTHNLQLSVLNLSQIRPVKPPVPVITPQGLMQTKLPTNSTIPPNMWQQPQQIYPHDAYRPAIISSQYNNQFYGNLPQYNGYGGPVTPVTFPAAIRRDTKPVSNDDDDWTDFISSQPASNSSNSFQTRTDSSFWATSPNIITNPGHFDGRGVNNRVQSRKTAVPSISAMPDLDFVTNSRTFSGKK